MESEKTLSDEQAVIVRTVRKVLEKYDSRYWRKLDRDSGYPEDLFKEIQSLGLASIPISNKYGGPGLGVREAALILEEINASGGNSQHFHGQYYLLFLLSNCADERIKQKYLPAIARGELRLQSFALTEPEAGSESTKIKTFARKEGDHYVVNGHKIFISRVRQSDLMLLVARTTSIDKVEKKTDGITLFLVDLQEGLEQIEVQNIRTAINSQTSELFINDLKIPSSNVIGEVGSGFKYLLEVLNPERILIASECIGDAKWFIEKTVSYAKKRIVFNRPIGANQGIQFPIASVYSKLLAAERITWHAATIYDERWRSSSEASESATNPKEIGKYANIAKYLASDLSTEAGSLAMDVHGGYSMSEEMDIERKFMENRLYRVAPVSQNLVLSYIAHSILDLPKSY
ncbi:MAG: acyl-CoA/acyl-ACP dehydrogenase [archaeon]|nr:acyl-CoA/acyl-ACP dehydrogenase [archaeon]